MSKQKCSRSRASEGSGRHRKLTAVREETMSSSVSLRSVSRSSFIRTGGGGDMPQLDLKKEYIRYCKLYSSEPLEIVSNPLDRASYGRNPITIDLKGKGLRGIDCIAIGKILAASAPIHHLNLSDCLLLPQGFQTLVEGLAKNPFLRVLELRGNSIQGVMTSSLGQMLQTNSSVKKLVLEWNCLGSSKSDFAHFCNCLALNSSLEELDLRSNQINAQAAIELAAAFHKNKSVKLLDLRWNSIGVAGAKALWDALRTNFILEKIQLCGNFIPDEIVSYIEQCLAHHKEREEMMKEFASRTTLLTRQLQEAETEFRHELDTVVKIYDAEELELKTALETATSLAEQGQIKLLQEAERSRRFAGKVEALKMQLEVAHKKEEELLEAIHVKEEHVKYVEALSKDELRTEEETHRMQVNLLQTEIGDLRQSLESCQGKVRELETLLKHQKEDCEMLEKALKTAKDLNVEIRQSYEDKIKTERDKWMNWKSGLDATERYEIRQLEDELKQIRESMMNRIRELEKEKIEVESSFRQLEVQLETDKTKYEHEASAIRSKLKMELANATERFKSEMLSLQGGKDRLEEEVNRQTLIVQKLQSEKGQVERQAELLKKKMSLMEEEMKSTSNVSELDKEILDLRKALQESTTEKNGLQDENHSLKLTIRSLEKKVREKDSIIAASLSRAKSEVKELTELLTLSPD